MKMKRLLWGFIAIAAVTLVGCGGGGGTSLMVGGERATQDAIDALEANLAAAEGARDAAEADVTQLTGQLDTANQNAMDLQGQLDTANQNAMDLQASIDKAEGDITELTTMRDKYKTEAADLQTKLDEANATVTQLTADLDEANQRLAEIERDTAASMETAMMNARIAREAQLRLAITGGRVLGTANDLPETASGVTEVTATRDAAGMVNIDVNGTVTDAYTGGSVSAGSSDWTPATLTKTDAVAQSQDTVMIYTDIEAPADVLFTTEYADDLTDILETDALAKLAMAAQFPTGTSNSREYGGTSGNPTSFRGTFAGVDGVFSCDVAAGCTLSTNASGELIAPDTGEDWSFSADMPNAATVKDPDTAYAYFGWWLNKPDTATSTHDVDVFAGGTTGHAANVTNAMTGTATYSGPAAGMYITKDFSAGAQTDAAYGSFTANASLTADFGDDSGAGTIKGSISGFMLDDTTPASWSVMLEDATLTNASAIFNGTSEANFGAGFTSNNAGTWQGSFYAGGGTADPDAQPGTVAGTFDAVTDSAAVIGGFGATK